MIVWFHCMWVYCGCDCVGVGCLCVWVSFVSWWCSILLVLWLRDLSVLFLFFGVIVSGDFCGVFYCYGLCGWFVGLFVGA